jgi:hypothetical protein
MYILVTWCLIKHSGYFAFYFKLPPPNLVPSTWQEVFSLRSWALAHRGYGGHTAFRMCQNNTPFWYAVCFLYFSERVPEASSWHEIYCLLFVVVHDDGVRLCLWTAAASEPIVHPADDIRVWRTMLKWHWRENRRALRKASPIATLSTTNPTWIYPGANPDLRGDRPATNRLSHSTALSCRC